MRKIFLFFVIFLMHISCAQDFSVGVSPLIVDLGEVERGGTEVVKFNIITRSTEPFFIYLEPEDGTIDFFNKAGYTHLISNYSEESVASWAQLLDDPIEADPINISEPGARSAKEVTILLEIPQDTEGGYHVVNIKPAPEIPAGGADQVGTTVIGIVSLNILFKTRGDAVRDGKILDVVQVPSSTDIAFKTYFKNTGTITMSTRVFQKIYDGDKQISEAYSTKEVLAPQGTKDFLIQFSLEGITFGKNYTISTVVDYTTGKAYMNSTMRIEPVHYIPDELEAITIPLWSLIILVIVVLMIIYRWVS